MFMWYVKQERKTRAFAQGLSGGKRVGGRPKGLARKNAKIRPGAKVNNYLPYFRSFISD
jgi:hypothetical protein